VTGKLVTAVTLLFPVGYDVEPEAGSRCPSDVYAVHLSAAIL
jgi:hypothetical protein